MDIDTTIDKHLGGTIHCLGCGNLFEVTAPNAKYCPECLRRKIKVRKIAKKFGHMVKCKKCGTDFLASSPNAQYCSSCKTSKQINFKICPVCMREFIADGRQKCCCPDHYKIYRKKSLRKEYEKRLNEKRSIGSIPQMAGVR
jgi:predicted RNA-binding Zn-ribbon protein involved in translation (DUF1610 family)